MESGRFIVKSLFHLHLIKIWILRVHIWRPLSKKYFFTINENSKEKFMIYFNISFIESV